MFAVNDFYLKDSSRKVRAVLDSKRERGEYCCCAPFGYMKNPSDKTKLIPNPETAWIVQRIFHLATEGKGAHTIADILTAEHVVTPSIYKLNGKLDSKAAAKANEKWTHTTVKRILENRVYLGHTILGKSKKPSYKSKRKKAIPKENWIVHENTHPALVTKETFDAANAFSGAHKKSWRDVDDIRKSIFSGIVFCKNCGGALCSGCTVYKGERDKYWYLSCNHITNKNHPCTCGARIKYATLIDIVTAELNSLICLSKDDIDEIIDNAVKAESGSGIYDSREQQLKTARKKEETLFRSMEMLYKDYVNGKISEDVHKRLFDDYQAQYQTVKEQIEQLERNQDSAAEIKSSYKTLGRFNGLHTNTRCRFKSSSFFWCTETILGFCALFCFICLCITMIVKVAAKEYFGE